ncbi:hypothetical protein Q1695_001314 [Nippostrongylus brasiliensis]|nr:hypothetical protein Q1695_001314 [Nippostrongylus brasiliensis]
MLSRNASPPGTPTKHSAENHELFKKKVSRTLSTEKKRSGADCTPTEITPPIQRPFKAAHDSFRLRMFQEQHGFEPVFMTKKRTRDNKSVMSEFKGGDLNKYTAKTYAIQNGNEVFGG